METIEQSVGSTLEGFGRPLGMVALGEKFGSPPKIGVHLEDLLELIFLALHLKNRTGAYLRVPTRDSKEAIVGGQELGRFHAPEKRHVEIVRVYNVLTSEEGSGMCRAF
jgi:hypothetical protein